MRDHSCADACVETIGPARTSKYPALGATIPGDLRLRNALGTHYRRSWQLSGARTQRAVHTYATAAHCIALFSALTLKGEMIGNRINAVRRPRAG